MGSRRMARVNELIKREIADGLYRVVNEAGFNFAAVTVTRVEVSADLHRAVAFISISGTDAERGRMMRLIRKHAADLQHRLAKSVRMKFIPHLTFTLDSSLAEGDRVLEIIQRLDQEQDTGQAGESEKDTLNDSEE